MIKYDLVCDKSHTFESWFSSSADYDKQRKKKLVTCPLCDSAKVQKAIMAPRLARTDKGAMTVSSEPVAAPSPGVAEKSPVAMMSPQEKEFRTKLKELRDHLVKNAENVGAKFPEQARKMHYGEIDHRSIFGEASPREAKELHDEGIEFHPLPILPEDRN